MSNEKLRLMALSLVDDGIAGVYADYAGAEQATMALGSVVNMMNQLGQLKSVAALNAGLANLRAGLQNDQTYKATDFATRLSSFRTLVATPVSAGSTKR